VVKICSCFLVKWKYGRRTLGHGMRGNMIGIGRSSHMTMHEEDRGSKLGDAFLLCKLKDGSRRLGQDKPRKNMIGWRVDTKKDLALS
jgi:hypothetical protein